MMRILKILVPSVILVLLLTMFGGWFSQGFLSSGDWPYLYPKAIEEIDPLSSWSALYTAELGQSTLQNMWFNVFALSLSKIALLVPWQIFERLVWFFPFVIVSFLSSYFLSRKIIQERYLALLSSVIYTTNTYILMVVAGGQVGVMMAYAFFPLVIFAFLNLLDKPSIRKSLIFSLTLSLLVVLDLRLAFIFLVASLVFYFLFLFRKKSFVKRLFYVYFFPGVVVLLLHSFWIFPIVITGANPVSNVSASYNSTTALDFFSFAKFENTISLLHANWPENIFGKVSFLRPEFLILPILAFASLLFANREKKERKRMLVALALTALIGAFMAKGTNEPFGEIYRYAFNNIPGFVMLRDPTKWYILTSVSFSILIPYSLFCIGKIVFKKVKVENLVVIVSLLFLLFWSYTVREAIFQNLGGTFNPKNFPPEYQKLAEKLSQDNNFYRTLWVPSLTTFAYTSQIHPGVGAVNFFEATSTAELALTMPAAGDILRQSSIKYIVLQKNNKIEELAQRQGYEEKNYQTIYAALQKTLYLQEVTGFTNLHLFELENAEDHFWSPTTTLKIDYEYVSPTHYKVFLKEAEMGDVVVFSESYDPLWQASVIKQDKIERVIKSDLYDNRFNSFIIKEVGDYALNVEYLPQGYVYIGLVTSLTSLFLVLMALFMPKNRFRILK